MQITCASSRDVKTGRLPLPNVFFVPLDFTQIILFSSDHAYTFSLPTVVIAQPLPFPISISGIPGTAVKILPFLFQTVCTSPVLLIARLPPSIGHAFNFQQPFPNFCAAPNEWPASDDCIR